jgi:predicted O-methyltransferase YrrM
VIISLFPRFLSRLPGYRVVSDALRKRYDRYGSNPFIKFAPPGHFYSPLPDIQFVDRYKATLFDRRLKDVPGIDIHVEDQLALLERFAEYYGEIPFKDERSPGLRYYFQNPYFSYGDAIILYSMLRHRRPKRIVEVGSGFSSSVMLDTNERFCSQQMRMTFIDPYPERLLSLLTNEDAEQHEIINDVVQNVPLERFAALGAGDVLFIDSSHVAKVGSDVVHLLTAVLPRLNTGVVVHFHDVFWPFEYPEEWIRAGRAWNENYVLKAFLQFNASFKVLFFNTYIAIHHGEVAQRLLPKFMANPGGSLWIEKTS